jgi:hypothetical protein
MPAIVHFGGIEKLEDARPLQVSGAAARGIEVVTYGAGQAVFVYLTYINEEVTVLSAAVIPLFQNFGNLRVMGSEASGAEENEISGLFGRKVNAQIQPPGCVEMWNSHIPSWGSAFGISIFMRSPVFSAAASKLAKQNPLQGSPFMPASLSALYSEQAET